MESNVVGQDLENTETDTVVDKNAGNAEKVSGQDSGNPEVSEKIETILEQGNEAELNKLKAWLFKENVRIISAGKELERMQEQFLQEKEQFQNEMKSVNRRLAFEKDRLKEDNLFFEKKMEILQSGFAKLDMDRRRLEKERAKLEAQKEFMDRPMYGGSCGEVSAFFRGVKNPLALKKRYKDLIKIFHPDNVAGDKEIIQMINKEYENLKRDYDTGKWA
ncbi:MAG: hypothetical protein NC318_09665 [Blautia sp.]|nr:hypothetical protein [Lachnoclostridium sp.]MCM1211857.1 hypothetical protein [Blautia sp.]